MGRCTTIIFDLDGTLIDSEPGVKVSFADAAKSVLPLVAFDPGGVIIGPPLPKMFAATFPMATDAQITDLVTAFRRHYVDSGWEKTRLFEGVEQVLAELHKGGFRLFVVTNKPLDISRKILRFFQLERLFEGIWSLDSVTPPFANKTEMVRSLLLEQHLKAEQCVLIGDTTGDEEAANASAVPFIWATYGYGRGLVARKAIKTITDLPQMLG